ncbi:MAG: hypothetical protein WBW81_10725 [Methylocella sp.]
MSMRGLDHVPREQLIALAKLVVPYGGLLRAGVRSGQVVAVNGATGYYGSAGVMTALAMGAAKVVAVGRDGKRSTTCTGARFACHAGGADWDGYGSRHHRHNRQRRAAAPA